MLVEELFRSIGPQLDGFLTFLVPTVIRRAAENNRFLAAAGTQTMQVTHTHCC
jgi:hypothetical protein